VAEALRATSAIDRAGEAGRGIRLGVREIGKIDLRGNAEDRGFMAAVGRVLDIVLPTDGCASAGKGDVTALWLGPDQWLLTCPLSDVSFFMNSLREALADEHHALTDVSDGRTVFRLSGPSARAVLAKGCPLDLHPRAFARGNCAGSGLAKAHVLIHLVEEDAASGPGFDVYVARSFARYLFAWLEDAGLEYGVQVAPYVDAWAGRPPT
jgi:sarcosine oxidase subunit gamma